MAKYIALGSLSVLVGVLAMFPVSDSPDLPHISPRQDLYQNSGTQSPWQDMKQVWDVMKPETLRAHRSKQITTPMQYTLTLHVLTVSHS